jgi:hypothetical protein
VSEVIDSASLRHDLMNAAQKLREAIDRARETSVEYVRLKHDYETAYAEAFIAAEGSAPLRKQIATLATTNLSREADEALERKRIAKLDVEAFQGIVSALQTVGSTARAEMRLAGYPS